MPPSRPASDPTSWSQLMGRDKKALNGLTFVLDGPTGVEVVAGVDRAIAVEVLEAMTTGGTTA